MHESAYFHPTDQQWMGELPQLGSSKTPALHNNKVFLADPHLQICMQFQPAKASVPHEPDVAG